MIAFLCNIVILFRDIKAVYVMYCFLLQLMYLSYVYNKTVYAHRLQITQV
jgi:hypothetical protein